MTRPCRRCKTAERAISASGWRYPVCRDCHRAIAESHRRKIGRKPQRKGRAADEVSTRTCECGCGEFVRESSRFIFAHHLRVLVKTPEHVRKVAEARRRYAESHTHDPLPRLLETKRTLDNGCWVPRSRHDNGHGYRYVTVRDQHVYIHRLSYERFVGPLIEGMEVDHTCRNRACFNPKHLEQVTHTENVRRANAARRSA